MISPFSNEYPATQLPIRQGNIALNNEKLSLSRILLYSFIFTMPVTNAFALNAWLPIPYLFALLLFLLSFFSRSLKVHHEDLAFIALGLIISIPWIWSAPLIMPKALLHFLAISSIVLVYFITARSTLESAAEKNNIVHLIYKLFFYAAIYLSIFIIIEFLIINLLGIRASSFIPYVEREKYDAIIVGGIQRARGFASESGSMALFYDLSLFFVLPLLTNFRRKLAYIAIIVPAYILLFSAGSFVFVGISTCLYIILKFKTRFFSYIKAFMFILLLSSILVYFFYETLQSYFLVSFLPKLALIIFDSSSTVGSASARTENYAQIIELISHYPFGVGFGVTVELGQNGLNYFGIPVSAGQLSFFGTFATAGGILGLVLISWIALRSLYRAYQWRKHYPELLCGGLALTLHHLIVSDYWQPYIWFFWALMSALYHANRVLKIKKSEPVGSPNAERTRPILVP